MRVPAGWHTESEFPRHRFAAWYSGSSGFRATYGAPASIRDPLPQVAGQQRKRCGISLQWKTVEASRVSGPDLVTESLQYAYEGVLFGLVYSYERGKSDPAIEQLLDVRCPAEILFATPPPGWQKRDAGIPVTWLPPQSGDTRPADGVVFAALASAGDSLTKQDFAELRPVTDQLERPLRFRSLAPTRSCGVPVSAGDGEFRGADPQAEHGIRLHVVLSKFDGRLYAAIAAPSGGPNDAAALAAVDSLCAKWPLPMRWLQSDPPTSGHPGRLSTIFTKPETAQDK